eukprot:gnl/TRDRNA2_/TRDRNA2_190864_c0_seq1.p1 gnl/TRDRNA2_/TRDRNA2_190864_c0~~gnl/TRDRNA2_/TRDRNA2_190864_c0_seq1.p1  ORF type:complete len:324 (-),score=52.65 gnl/TRDRNA2_/TRDRNA2_190864_c0_seq1:14-985(-)
MVSCSASQRDDNMSMPTKLSSGGCTWEIDMGDPAKPVGSRPKAKPRPPKWAASVGCTYGRGVRRVRTGTSSAQAQRQETAAGMSLARLDGFKAKQLETLGLFRQWEEKGDYDRWHRAHFDWWAFPIDDGSKAAFNVTSEEDVEALRSDPEWLSRYHECVVLVARSWGWDVEAETRIADASPGQHWRNLDVRLAKICRSLYLFEQEQLLSSMQKFATEIQQCEKEGKSFFYGMICLDELLYFELPRRPQIGAAVSELVPPANVDAPKATDLAAPEVATTLAGAFAEPLPPPQCPVDLHAENSSKQTVPSTSGGYTGTQVTGLRL